MFHARVLLAVTVLGIACSAPPPATPVTAAPPAEAPPPAPVVSKADALIEDLRRREAAQAKFDRENPTPAAPRLDDLIRPSASAPVASVMPEHRTVTAAPSAAAPVTDARDESWWKNQMRNAETRLTDNARRLQEATDRRDRAQRQMQVAVDAGSIVFAQAQEAYNRASAEVGRLEAEVRNDRAAVERVREDARRANVPPGWLRWP